MKRLATWTAALVAVSFCAALAACSVRAGESLAPTTRKDLADSWGAVVVTLPDRILWEHENTDRREHGVFYLHGASEDARRMWTEAITDRLAEHGFKMYPAQLSAALETPLVRITPDEYAESKRSAIVLETGNRGKPSTANGNGTQFLLRPLIVVPGRPQGIRVDRPMRYELAPLVERDVDWVVAVDLTEWVLVVQENGTVRSGYALVHVAVLDLADYRVRAFGREEKPAADRRGWIFGPAVGEARFIDLRKGNTAALTPAFQMAGGRLADLAERQMGLLTAEGLRDREYLWDEP